MNLNYEVRLAELPDLDSWMAMIGLVRDNFPGLDTAEQLEGYRQTVIKNISRSTAICAMDAGEVVGLLLFSCNSKCLSCMAVHPGHRRQGIASAMLELMLSFFPADAEISVTTFRAEDEKGTAPRPLYQKFGFVEAELTEEFDYPHQRFVLKR